MSLNRDEIESLIIAEIVGDISDEERLRLQHLLLINSEAAALYEEMHKVLSSDAAKASREATDSGINVESLMSSRTISAYIPKWALLTTTAICFLVLVIVLTIKRTTVAPLIPSPNGSVQLVFSNGQHLDLDSINASKKLSALGFSKKNDTLSLKSTNTQDITIIVPTGRNYKLILPDGTKVILNSATEFRFLGMTDNSSRNVFINGEAYLDVAPDVKRPFLVTLPQSRISVLGTVFNVNTYDGKETVSLISGKVRMEHAAGSVDLTPGKEGILDHTLSVRTFQADMITSWQKGIYVFQHSTFEEVAPVLERWFNMKVIVEGTVKSKHFYGIIDRNKPIREFFETLQLTNEINYEINGSTIRIW